MSNPRVIEKGIENGVHLKITKKSIHDYSILFREKEGNIPFIDDVREMDTLIGALNERFKSLKISIKRVRYDGEIFNCIYVDVIENGNEDNR